jgi:hypothetical protein
VCSSDLGVAEKVKTLSEKVEGRGI